MHAEFHYQSSCERAPVQIGTHFHIMLIWTFCMTCTFNYKVVVDVGKNCWMMIKELQNNRTHKYSSTTTNNTLQLWSTHSHCLFNEAPMHSLPLSLTHTHTRRHARTRTTQYHLILNCTCLLSVDVFSSSCTQLQSITNHSRHSFLSYKGILWGFPIPTQHSDYRDVLFIGGHHERKMTLWLLSVSIIELSSFQRSPYREVPLYCTNNRVVCVVRVSFIGNKIRTGMWALLTFSIQNTNLSSWLFQPSCDADSGKKKNFLPSLKSCCRGI